MLLRELDDPPSALETERAATRVLEGGDEIEQGGRGTGAQRLLERIRVEPLVVAREQLDVGAELPQDLQRPVVGRQLGEHPFARSEALGEKHEALQRPVGQEHAGRIDAVPVRDPLAKRRIARRWAVREDRAAVAFDRNAGAIRQLVDRQAFGGGDTTRERDRRHRVRLPSEHLVVGGPDEADAVLEPGDARVERDPVDRCARRRGG